MKKQAPLTCAGIVGLCLFGGAAAQDVHIRTIAATCMSCHGPGGKSVGKNPSLAGQNKTSFVESMKAFKSGERTGTIMKRHASGYTDAEIEALGAYFASLK